MDRYSFVYVSFLQGYCLYPFWNSSRSKKLRLGCKKLHGFVAYSVTHRMRPSQLWFLIFFKPFCLFESSALLRGLWRTCHLMEVELSDRLFGQNKPFFSPQHLLYVYVCFVENVAAFVWLVSVWLIIHTNIFIFFLFITQIILIAFVSGQIHHLYDVYNNCIIEKTYSGMYNDENRSIVCRTPQ